MLEANNASSTMGDLALCYDLTTGAGGAAYAKGATLSLSGSTLRANVADASGGGAYAVRGAVVEVRGGSSLVGNEARDADGREAGGEPHARGLRLLLEEGLQRRARDDGCAQREQEGRQRRRMGTAQACRARRAQSMQQKISGACSVALAY